MQNQTPIPPKIFNTRIPFPLWRRVEALAGRWGLNTFVVEAIEAYVRIQEIAQAAHQQAVARSEVDR